MLPAASRAAELRCDATGRVTIAASHPGQYEWKTASGQTRQVQIATVPAPLEISGAWDVRFPPKWGAPEKITMNYLASLSESTNDGIKYFSGTATYTKTFDWNPNSKDENLETWLDLGDVQVMAQVKLNGHDLGVLWKAPFRINVTDALKRGRNTLEIRVADLWPNRMIGDAALPAGERFTWSSYEPFTKDSPLPESGLLGPVTILSTVCATATTGVQNPLESLKDVGADWGIWIDNGLVNPGEAVRMTVSVPLDTPSTNLPATLEVYPRYLENTQTRAEKVPLRWEKIPERNRWQAPVSYRPRQAGNYYAACQFYGREIYSYFAVWKPGITAVNFWVAMPVEYHDAGNLKDLYRPEIDLGHLPFDYELFLVGELVFKAAWAPRELFRRAQVEAGAEVIPFLDGGYFHKLDPRVHPTI